MRRSYHYSAVGTSQPPRPIADVDGYVSYRESVVDRLLAGEDVPGATQAEQWTADQERRIAAWRAVSR